LSSTNVLVRVQAVEFLYIVKQELLVDPKGVINKFKTPFVVAAFEPVVGEDVSRAEGGSRCGSTQGLNISMLHYLTVGLKTRT